MSYSQEIERLLYENSTLLNRITNEEWKGSLDSLYETVENAVRCDWRQALNPLERSTARQRLRELASGREFLKRDREIFTKMVLYKLLLGTEE